MISAIVSRIIILLFGNLYPAYASYKAVRTKNVKEYVKWMMYWIVFAFFSCIETFTDIFLAWFPFYYEVKVILVLWLLSPATKGSSTLYRKFVHPMLTKRENEIDEYISQAKEKGYTAVLQLGSKGVNYATSVIMQTAIKTINGTQLVPNSPQQVNSARPHAITPRDTIDGNELRMQRSRSVDSALDVRSPNKRYSLRTHTQHDVIMEGLSEEDDEMVACEGDLGAARIRGVPTRKVAKTKPAAQKAPPRTLKATRSVANGVGVKGRRKLKPEPDPDYEDLL